MSASIRGTPQKKQSAANAPSTTTNTGYATVTGDTLYVAINDADASIAISDNKGNTFSRVQTQLASGSTFANVWVCQNATGGANHTVTATATAMNCAIMFFAIQGVLAASLDASAQAVDAVSPYTATTGTLAQADELVIAFMAADGSPGSFTPGGGFTTVVEETNDALYWTANVANLSVSSTAAVTATWTTSGGTGSAIIVATFKSAAGGAAALAATATDVATTAAALSTQVKLGAAAADSVSSSAALTTAIKLAMTAVVSASATGALAAGAVLQGAALDVVAAVGALSTAVSMNAAAADAATASAALTNYATVTLSGALYTGQGGALDPHFWVDSVPQLGTTLYYDATHITIYPNAEVSSDVTDCLAEVYFFDGTSWARGTIMMTSGLAAYADGNAGATAQMTTAVQLAAAASALATAAAAFSTGAGLTAVATDTAAAAGAISTAIPLSALAQDAANAAGALIAQIKLIAAATDQATAHADMNGVIVLIAAAAALSAANGALSTGIIVAGAAQDSAAAAGSLTTQVRLSGAAQDAAAAVGALTTAIAMGGAAHDAVTSTGDLTTARLLVAAALDAAAAIAILSTGISITANAASVSQASAALNTASQMMADAASSATVTALLSDVIESPPVGAYVLDETLVVSKSLGGIGTRITPRFRSVDADATDVLTFDLSDQLVPGETLVGRVSIQIACIAGMDANSTALLFGVPSYSSDLTKIMQPRRGGLPGSTYLIKVSAATTNPQKRVALTGLLPVQG